MRTYLSEFVPSCRAKSFHRIPPIAVAAVLAMGGLSAPTASAEVIAGWDTFDNGVNPTVPVSAAGVTASMTTVGNGRDWITSDERGASDDGTWGTSVGPPSADTTVGPSTADNLNLELSNATTDGTITLSISNDSGADIDLDAFHFDANAFRSKAARTYELSVLAGGAITEGVIYTSEAQEINVGGNDNSAHDDIDHDLTFLADSTLENGGSVEFLLSFSGGAGDGSGGHDLWIDNIAVTSSADDANKLAFAVVPASATAGTDFSVTVEAQNSSGEPLPGGVAEDTQILLGASGMGTLSGNTATILSGTSSVILPALQYTLAEIITLNASQVSGDLLSPSEESSEITIIAGPASVVTVESANDGTGTPIRNTSFRINDPFDVLDVFAISRDSAGNFIAYETGAVFSLQNVTGSIMTADLADNMDGSATFTAQALGTANIRATVSGFDDGDSGLITVEEPQFRWTSTLGNKAWGTAGNWLDAILPTFDSTTDIFLHGEYSTPSANTDGVNSHIGDERTIRSLNITEFVDTSHNIRFTQNGSFVAQNLIMDTDSLVDPVVINIDAGAEGNVNLGNVNIPLNADDYGDLVLADPLLITHLGTGNLLFSRPVAETGESMGVTIDASSTGLVVYGGANTYTGPTTVNGGILRINGDSIADAGTLVIDGGVVDVAADENVAGLTLGGVAQPNGVYGSSSSAAPVPDDENFSGTGTISVGPPPATNEIVITKVSLDGTTFTMEFTSPGLVDVYRSDDWEFAYDFDQPSGTYVDSFADGERLFYILVTAGDPGPVVDPNP